MSSVVKQDLLTHRTSAKAIASLMLLQMALGILLNFYFLKPILVYSGDTPGTLLNSILGSATLLALLLSTMNLAFGLLLPTQHIKRHFRILIPVFVFSVVGIAMCAIEYAQLAEYVNFLTTLEQSSSDTATVTTTFMKSSLASGRNEAHFLSIFISSLSLLFFYVLMFRSRLLPAVLSGFAMISVLLQLIAVGHTFFQASIPNIIQLPLAITQFIVPLYLFAKGFKYDDAMPSTSIKPAQ